MAVVGAAETGNSAFFNQNLAKADPEIARAIADELARQQDKIELIASENIVCRGGARGAGLGADQQIRRRLSRPALLRRLRICRCRGGTRDRARLPPVRLFVRECPAAFRRAGEPGGVLRAAAARRHVHGPRSRRRRPSHPRLARQPVGQVVQAGALQRAPPGPAHRHGRGRAHREREHKPKLIIAGGSAYPRFIDFKRFREIADSVGAYLHGRHGAFRRAWWRAASIPIRSTMPMSSPRRRTRRCAARAAA